MERILREFKSSNNSCCDCYEEISLITYLANLTQDEIITNEIEAASNILHCALTSLYENHYDIIQDIFNKNSCHITLIEKASGSSFNIFIKDTWLFQIILINSIKHTDIVNNGLNHSHLDLLTLVVDHILKNIDIAKPLSLHLLRTLLLIITKRKDTLLPNLNREILSCMNKVAVSPITVFRQYAREISKQVISSLPAEVTIFLDISLLPMKGIDMYDIVKRFPKTFIRENQHHIVKKVLSMFLRNVESKDGGALYECLLFYSFEEWGKEIWPLFLDSLRYIDYEG
ncbi:uncharacterized protein LOC108904089 [Anoplophora glabripennis]|uniref:uncharacterized protein LOC108904089 n=1 Tax=Anoplophora glabripennis TaxID=217634 RepID=UPI0008738C1F|nr:uncharacterized protein LOC108904089 [Anoplophora glabripennis]